MCSRIIPGSNMRTPSLTLFLCFALFAGAAAQSQSRVNLMPMPAHLQPGAGQLVIRQSFSVAIAGHDSVTLDRAVQRFVHDLSRTTGMPLNMTQAGPSTATLVIQVDRDRKPIPAPGEDESYELNVSSSAAKLTAANTLGVMHGLQTFLQLVELAPDGFVVPAISIQDQPRFPWRGVLIDVSRHFIPLDVLKRNLDGMAAVKMNVLHWHLSDNEGFRVESKRFPKLHQEGSEGLFYTQQEIREFVAYAGDRGIRVVPEFDMPGHTRSFFVGYPELASAPGPYKVERTKDDQDPAMNPTLDKTYQFLDKFIGEMAGLFPDPYFHIGGDELNGTAWAGNAKIQEFMRTHGMKNNQELQAYFNARLQKIVSKHGKTMMGWDEILQPDLPSSVMVQSWRGQDSLAAAAKLGHSGVLSFGYYLDLMWPASRHYAIDPMADNAATLSPEEKQRVLGGETCMWAEFITPENIDSRIWPRAAAIAERFWSPQDVQDVPSMYRRLGEISWRLEELGLTHNANDIAGMQRMAGTNDIASLRVLAAVVEPVKDYTRMDSATVIVTSKTPLNRLVDGVHPESDEARNFADLVNVFAASGYKDAASEARIRASLLAWRDNDTRLQPLLQQSFLLKEVAPISQDLAALADAALRALDYLGRGETPPAPWKTDQLARIEQAKKPRADLLLMVLPALQKLIEAPGNRTASGTE